MEEPAFVEDDRDPFEELASLPTIRSSKHVLVDFEIGLNEIKDAAPKMKEYSARCFNPFVPLKSVEEEIKEDAGKLD